MDFEVDQIGSLQSMDVLLNNLLVRIVAVQRTGEDRTVSLLVKAVHPEKAPLHYAKPFVIQTYQFNPCPF